MTREDAINLLSQFRKDGEGFLCDNTIEAFKMAIKALEQEPCDDAINREDALMCLTGEIKDTDTIETIIARFVRRIRKLPSVNPQQPCGDAIGREDMLDAIGHGTTYTSEELQRIIKGLPPVTPQPKTGYWINAKVGKFFPSNDFKCSECGNILDFNGVNCGRGDANYCPNCGAKMFKSQESEGV